MKYFLVIPAFFLFLSNIPFIHEMDKEEMMAVATEEGCCNQSDEEKSTCKMPDKKQEHTPAKKSCHNEEDTKCGTQSESTCICICVFQFAAPDQLDAKLQFGINNVEQSLSIYLQQNWKDPQLALPWQPPDVMMF